MLRLLPLARVLGETLEIKESSDYQSVNIPNIRINIPLAEQPPEVAPQPTKAYQIPIEEVEAGAIAARDVITENGEMLLEAGSVLGASYLNRLKDISEIIGLPSIWIRM